MIHALMTLAALTMGGPETVQVEPLPFDLAAFRAMDQKEIRVTEKGQSVVYRGVPLRILLADYLKGGNAMVNLRDLSDAVILVRADDGYQTAVSAAEVAMDESGEGFLIAMERDGKPLGEDRGPARLVVPHDPKPVRWIYRITSADLVRMPRPKAK